MTHKTGEKPLYYAKDGMVWKRPTKTNFDGETILAIGFPVCEMHEAAGADCAPIVAHLMNLGEAAQSGTEADLRKQIADLGAEVARLGSRLNARVAPSEIARLRELIDIIVDETGVDTFCANDPDDESVGVRTGADGAPVPLPMTFGHVRRARQALDKTVERVNALEAELKDEREYAHALQVALTGIAGGGSENFVRHGDDFRADIPVCVQKITERHSQQHEINRAALKKVHALEAENKRLREALNWYGNKKNWWVANNHGIGHHNMGDGSMEHYEAKPGTVDQSGHFFPDYGCFARAALTEARDG